MLAHHTRIHERLIDSSYAIVIHSLASGSAVTDYRINIMTRSIQFFLLLTVTAVICTSHTKAFSPIAFRLSKASGLSPSTRTLRMSDGDLTQETFEQTQERIKNLVDQYPVILFMKGSKIFPQCGFSNTAVQILNSFNINFHTVDVLSDDAVRQGVKVFSQWPTIPQLYVAGEFIGGSDIMIELYQSGELGEMIEKAKADMV